MVDAEQKGIIPIVHKQKGLTPGKESVGPVKGEKRSRRVTIIVNILFIAAICAVGWLIADHLIQDRKSAELSDDLWQQVAVTKRPEGQDTEKTAEPAASSATAVPQQDDHGTGTETESTPETGTEQQTGAIRTAEPREDGAETEAESTAETDVETEKETASGLEQQAGAIRTTEPRDKGAEQEAEPVSQENPKEGGTVTEILQEADSVQAGEETAAFAAPDAGEKKPETEIQAPEGTNISAENRPETESPGQDGADLPMENQPETEIPAPVDADIPVENESAASTGSEPVPAEEQPGKEQTAPKDDPDIPEQIDFDALWQISADAAAWLYAPDIGLNQAVMHTDNNEFYLTHMADGTQNKAGALFIDCRNAEGLANRNTIIYGHSMKNQSMFGKLKAYEDEAYCREHPVLYLYLPEGRFRLEIVAAVGTPDLSDYYRIPVSRERWEKLLQDAISETAYNFGVPVAEEDRFVTLSTCAYDYQDERWIVICRVDDPQGILPPLAE